MPNCIRIYERFDASDRHTIEWRFASPDRLILVGHARHRTMTATQRYGACETPANIGDPPDYGLTLVRDDTCVRDELCAFDVGNTDVNSSIFRIVVAVLVVTMANPMVVLSQVPPPQGSGGPPGSVQPGGAQAVFRVEEIDQLTAPIAIYPDQLLAQVLIASTYPLEVVMADRWVSAPENAKLSGEQLAAALEGQTWDPSVKSLVPFPQVLKMMSERLDWTQRLGDAFLAQQADVMSSVQRLRRQAQGAGNLKTTEQQTVVTERETIVIQPSNPEVVYVPTYNPTVVYGQWPYPEYPPPYYPPAPAYYPGYYPGSALAAGIGFGLGVAAIGSLWGWGDCNWGGSNININAGRYNNINSGNIRAGRATQLPANANQWRHDPSHRGGVAYRDPGSRQSFQRSPRPTPVGSEFRGYDRSQRGAGQVASRPTATPRGGSQAREGGARPRAAQGTGAGIGAASSRRQPSAFQGMGNGSQIRSQADRGRTSRQSFASQSRPSASMGGATRGGGSARGGGGGSRGGGGRGGGGRR